VYFDDVAGSKIKKGRATWIIWLYAHIPLQIGVTAVGVAVKKAVHFDWQSPAPEAYRWLLLGSLALVYFSVAAVDSVTERRQAELSDRARVNVRWISGVLLLVLAPAGRAMSGGLLLALALAINVAQVLFDMIMAPFEAVEDPHLGARTTAEIVKEHKAGGRAAPRLRRDLTDAIRKGTPSELRRDLYFYFIEGSWARVFVAFALLFLASNIFFAGLYILEPGSISNADPESFMDAFFFSVQTMSTIGYGGLSPATAYGNLIVSIEAALSVIGVAIVTGLVFAKVSRPRSSVLFSKPILLTTIHGKRTLTFRVGNARGNEVVDASIDLTLLKDEITPEGQHFRKLHDLKLVRSRSPMFSLSWTVMHEIEEDGPLSDVDWTRPEEHIVGFIVTLMGHDGTYGQTVFARKTYDCGQIRQDEHFVDVVHQLEDGRLMVDYTRFHDTEPDEPAQSESGSDSDSDSDSG
jgi:inward rectifier potassium channel